MTEQLKKFSSEDFNPDKYVREVSQVCVGGPELFRHKAKIQAFADETSLALKKNVYKNYMQFIETAREISHLEGEMYQLSHLLSEQRALLGSMGSQPPPLEVAESNDKEEKRTERLTAVMDAVDNCPNLLDATVRDVCHEGDLLELDALENTAIRRTRAFLLTDRLLIASWVSERVQVPVRYRYETDYDLSSLAVVNVRDPSSDRYAFKLLVFPETRMFQCTNAQTKEEWMKKFDEAKRAYQSGQAEAKKARKELPARADSVDSGTNPFGYWDDDFPSSNANDSLKSNHPDWLLETPDDLEVLIAQRHFEDTLNLIERANSYLADHPQNDIQEKVTAASQTLIKVLLDELSLHDGGERSLQGGLRALRRSVRLLNRLGKSAQSVQLYLKACTSVLRSGLRRVRREGSTLSYVKRASQTFFSTLNNITAEFQYRAFPGQPSVSSAFVVWAAQEVSHFMSHFTKQVFVSTNTLSTLAESMALCRSASTSLTYLGLHLDYLINGHLITPLTKSLNETKDKLVDVIRLRLTEETWRPMNAQEHSASTLAFVKVYTTFLNDVLELLWPDLEHAADAALYEVFDSQLRHMITSKDGLSPDKATLVANNARYLMTQYLPSCKSKYKEKIGHSSAAFDKLSRNHALLLKDAVGISSVIGYV